MSELTKQQKACKKLDDMYAGIEKKEAQQRFLAEKIVEYLKARITEDEGLAEDILKEGKSWNGCNTYLYDVAKKAAKGSRGFYAEGETILEWAEDYFRSNEKDPKPKGATKKASGKVKIPQTKNSTYDMKKAIEKATAKPEQPKADEEDKEPEILAKPKKAKKPKKQTDEESGQMSIFDLLGGFGG